MADGKTSKEVLAEQNAARWAKLRAENEKSPPPTAAELAQLAKDRADSVGDVERTKSELKSAKLPAVAKVALGMRRGVFNPKIHAENVANFKAEKIAALAYIARCDAVIAAERKPGEVRSVYLMALARVIAWGAAATGKYEKTFRLLCRLLASCVETARKAVRWFEEHRLMDTKNVLDRVNRDLWRGPNLYLPLVEAPPEAAADAPPVPPELAPLARATETLNRWAHRFPGLVARPWGLNATPVASKHLNPRRERDEPAPA